VPRADYPTDRFDDLPDDTSGRVGAHRAENPRMRAGIVLLWAAVATVVLIGLGILGTLLATGQIVTATPTASVAVTEVEGVVDTSFPVLVLNATTQDGLAGSTRDQIIAAGWAENDVTDGEAGSQDFAYTTVFYSDPADEAAARGLADDVLGGARIELSDAYASVDDASTDDVDESQTRQLVVVIGADWTDAAGDTEESPEG